MAAHDAVLLLAFGGPTRFEEVRPFLDNVLRGRPVPKERYEEVVDHYKEVGGASPLHRLTFGQADGLRDELRRDGPDLPVFVGMRHWEPYIHDTLMAMAREGRRRAVGLILAAHPSEASRESYHQAVDEGRRRLGADAPEIDYVDPWFDHPLFIEAQAARVREALAAIPEERRSAAVLVCTAHSIPVGMARASRYDTHLTRTAELVSRSAGFDSFRLAYQSRSGRPEDPWLEPDIGDALRTLGREGARDAVVAPIGFVSDHVEVLYDLDVAASRIAAEIGLGFRRAGTVGDHPAFLRMMAEVVRDKVTRGVAAGHPA
jgi:ferrochelatase